MKRFEFSMQYLADIRAAREQAAEQSLMAALKEQAEAECVLDMLIKRRTDQVRSIEQMAGTVRRTEWSERVRYLQDFERRIVQRREELGQIKARVQRCRDELKREMTERRIVEKLKGNEKCQWVEEARQEEQKQMDELAAGRWIRQEESE